ncbi:hypothetical protein [Streptomyces griseomycini]|uniref:Uncharacterized protein n=1 Tax=Streptomyces griseomycini TaxID=66895 RepID=A0A7W7PY96_9ACTN|nr:hypothetical protein [Streptomyces griseomycini]MBB4903490.1 hypothetical protein [Streptomyces griseomycini]GGR57853.1 hypothetical protein GCM10015536_73200 [Streptomyces griseomycini]
MASRRDPRCFTGAGRAAPALVEAVLRPSADGEGVSDALCAQAAEHCASKALATLMSAIGRSDSFTPVALVAEPVSGRSFTGPWK